MRGRLPVLLALALVACRRDAPAPPSPEPSPSASSRAAPEAGPAAAPTENAGEVQLDSLLGIWRVVAVVPGAGASFETDDPRVVGALVDVYPDRLAWSYSASKAFSPADLCLGPVSGLIDHAAIAGEVRAALAPARRRGGTEAGQLSRPHRWLCGDGGEWGDEAEFQVIGRDRMAMRWPGDLLLVLERIRRVSGDPPALPPTGAFEPR